MTNFDYPALFRKKLHFPLKTDPFVKILALQTNKLFSKFPSFLSQNLFVKHCFSSENVHSSLKIADFGEFFSKIGANFKVDCYVRNLK